MIKVRVPATSANMGPGFDSMGIALSLYNYFYVEETKKGLHISGCDQRLCNESNLVYQSMIQCFEAVAYKVKGLTIRFESEIPLSRGFGSSASCILGGVLAANEIAGKPLDKGEILDLAIKIEGHPDNVAPALFGQLVLSIMENNKVLYNQVSIADGIKFCALVPDFTLSTKKAREVLPETIPFTHATFNVSHATLLVTALMNGNHELIQYACQDRLHQPYRGKLIANYNDIIKKCKDLNVLAAYLSGAGPTIMTILKQDDTDFVHTIRPFLNSLPNHWDLVELNVDLLGSTVEKI